MRREHYWIFAQRVITEYYKGIVNTETRRFFASVEDRADDLSGRMRDARGPYYIFIAKAFTTDGFILTAGCSPDVSCL